MNTWALLQCVCVHVVSVWVWKWVGFVVRLTRNEDAQECRWWSRLRAWSGVCVTFIPSLSLSSVVWERAFWKRYIPMGLVCVYVWLHDLTVSLSVSPLLHFFSPISPISPLCLSLSLSLLSLYLSLISSPRLSCHVWRCLILSTTKAAPPDLRLQRHTPFDLTAPKTEWVSFKMKFMKE